MPQFSITTTTTTTTTTTITTTLTTNTHHFSSLIFSYFVHFCYFVLSHPLYFSYFIFFSPYLLKLISFLSPLFITTFLFLLAILTIHNHPYNSESKVGLFISSYQKVLSTLSCGPDEENVDNFHIFEELEACMVVHGNDTQNCGFPDLSTELPLNIVDENAVEIIRSKSLTAIDVQELSHSKPIGLTSESPVEVDPARESKCAPEKISHSKTPKLAPESQVEELTLTNPTLSKDKEHKVAEQALNKVKEHNEILERLCLAPLSSCASMRKEKEWKRTLACKLYEERQNIGGSEGMDSLWEEAEPLTAKVMKNSKNKEKVKNALDYDEEKEEEEDEMYVNLCCLQALKLSTGKMNLGMKRPNLVRISKALKGMGWFHHVSKHGKEGLK